MNRLFRLGLLVALVWCWGGRPAKTQSPSPEGAKKTVIRLAMLAPEGSVWANSLLEWSKTVSRQTDGRVTIEILAGGEAGDDHEVLWKIGKRTLEAALVSQLGAISRSAALMLSAPKIGANADSFERTTDVLDAPLRALFEEAGFVVLSWSYVGGNRIFSTKPFATPSDLPKLRIWAWRDNETLRRYLAVAGAKPVSDVSVPYVYVKLARESLDGLISTPISSIALQWDTKVKYVTKQSINVQPGALVIRKDVYEQLSPHDKRLLVETAERTVKALNDGLHKDEKWAEKVLFEKRGLIPVDLMANRDEWEAVAFKTRESFIGDGYSAKTLRKITAR